MLRRCSPRFIFGGLHNLTQPEQDSLLQHNLSLDVLDDSGVFQRNVKHICTIGPSVANPKMIRKLIENGMNCARFNFSHGSHEYHGKNFQLVRSAAQAFVQCHCSLALDTSGCEIRLGKFLPLKQQLQEQQEKEANSVVSYRYNLGDRVVVTTDEKYRNSMTKEKFFVDYKSLISSSSSSSTSSSSLPKRLLISDGVLELEIIGRVRPSSLDLECVARSEATISSNANVHIPGVEIDLPAISEKDIADLKFGAQQKVDFVFASFARHASHIQTIRDLLHKEGSDAGIVAKIESHEGIRNLKEILQVCDAVMVARGDLGVDLEPERVFLAQKKIIAECNLVGKPAICATQMLESMRTNPRPTRAEVADVANAVIDGSDCTMLSGETANGHYPLQSLATLSRISAVAFNYIRHGKRLRENISIYSSEEFNASTSAAAVLLSRQNHAKCIITLTKSGNSVRQIRKYSPQCPVVAVCHDVEIARKLSVVRNVIPLCFLDEQANNNVAYDNFDDLISLAINHLGRMTTSASGLVLNPRDVVIVSCTDPLVLRSRAVMNEAKSYETFVRIHVVS